MMQANVPALADQASPEAETEPALPFRSDTILGVCEALGQDFGFNPNYLRVVLASLVLWNPLAMLAIYLGLGAAVAISRWLYPAPRPTAAAQRSSERAIATADNESETELLAA